MTARHWLAIVALIALFAGGFASAHHSHASLDRDDVRRMSGVVTRYLWRSPHVYIQVNVLRDDGSIAEYTMEMNNPMSMSRAGWNKDTWQVGDRILWEGAHDRDKDRTYMGLTWAEREDGSRLYINSRDQKAYLEEDSRTFTRPSQPSTITGRSPSMHCNELRPSTRAITPSTSAFSTGRRGQRFPCRNSSGSVLTSTRSQSTAIFGPGNASFT
jgi:hypothetical protein